MNTTSPELSKELCDLSGWKTPSGEGFDLGFLMRRLPEFTSVCKRPASTNGGKQYTAWVDDYQEWNDTPEDAAATLAIMLFKQGVLGRDAS